MSDIAKIGHNRPDQTPFDEIRGEINDLYSEARLWLDGEKVETQEQADALNTLSAQIKHAAKTAETLRKETVKPIDDEKKAIQAQFNPLKAKTEQAIDCIKQALKPFLIELDRQQQEAAKIAQQEADEKQRLATEAMIASRDNLEAREAAERLAEDAKKSAADANRASKQKAHAGGEGRAVGLRTVTKVSIADEKLAARWVWLDPAEREQFMVYVLDRAQKAVRAGATKIDGFNITQEKVI
jgi:hypothetical protein